MFAFFHEEFAHSSKTNFLIIPELPGLQDVVQRLLTTMDEITDYEMRKKEKKIKIRISLLK
jgi:hypothetical protein